MTYSSTVHYFFTSKHKIITSFILVIAPLVLLGQLNERSDSVLLEEVYQLIDKEEYVKAIEKAKMNVTQIVEHKNWKGLCDFQRALSMVGYFADLPNEVLSHLYDNHQAIPDSMRLEKGYSSFYLGFIEEYSGHILKGLHHYENALKPMIDAEDYGLQGNIYGNLGLIYTQLGDYKRAEKYYKASGEILQKLKDEENDSYNIYNLAENHKYQENYLESENYYRKYAVRNPKDIHEIYYQISTLKVGQNQIDSARYYYKMANKFNSESQLSEGDLNALYADILHKEGNMEGAIHFLQKSSEWLEEIGNVRSIGKHYFKLADLYFEKGDGKLAIEYFNKSLASFSEGKISIDSLEALYQNPSLFYEIWMGDILMGLSNVYFSITEIKDQKKAEKCIELAMEVLDRKRSLLEDLGSTHIMNKKAKKLYEQGIGIYLSWHEEQRELGYFDKAFQLAQRHNAFVLRQEVNERSVFDRFNVSGAEKQRYFSQKLAIVDRNYTLGLNFDENEFKTLKREERKLDSIKIKLFEGYEGLEEAMNDFEVTSLQEVQQKLGKKESVFKYFEGAEKLFVFVITRDKSFYFECSDLQEIKDQISTLRALLSNFKYDLSKIDSLEQTYLTTGYELYTTILKKGLDKLPKRIDKITIIPTGVLTQIPFEPIPIRKKNSWSDSEGFLFDRYAISYNYFCKALVSTSENKHLKKALSYGLEYDTYTLREAKKFSKDSVSQQIIEKFRSEEMGHLFFADDEAQEVAALLNGVSYTNTEATKESFLENVEDYDIIHLSAHSFVDFQYPENSSIIFTKRDSLTDHLLKVKDIDKLSLEGQLFTLSACNTFYGKKNEGEGLSSIARSFIQSGAGSVVGSFWSVPDEISKTFMVHFYSNLKKGMTKDEALRRTKMDFLIDDDLSNPLYRSPAYWSAWVVYGDTSPIGESNPTWPYFLFGAFFFLLLYFFTTKRRSNGGRKNMVIP